VVPGAAQHEVVRCRPGIVTGSERVSAELEAEFRSGARMGAAIGFDQALGVDFGKICVVASEAWPSSSWMAQVAARASNAWRRSAAARAASPSRQAERTAPRHGELDDAGESGPPWRRGTRVRLLTFIGHSAR